jgi:glycosyltransferase involved in cell wall biosynthesis
VEIIKSIMAKDSRIKLNINSSNIGFSANANKLISLANYDYIALFHSDDIYHPTIIEKEMEFLSSNSDLAGCFTESKFIGQNSLELTKEVKHFKSNGTFSIIDFDTYLNFLFKRGGSMFMCPTALIKKSIYQEFNGFDESLKYIDDQDMYLRILLKYNFGIIHSRLINYRIHENQGSKVYSSSSINNLSIVYKHLIDFVEGNNEIKIKYQLKLNKVIAEKYLRLSLKHLDFQNFYKYIYFIKKAKSYFRFRGWSINYLLQYSDNHFFYYFNSIMYPFVYFIVKKLKRLKGFNNIN